MNFLILDPYTNNNWRLVKDTAGGYGTGNDFGNSLFSKLINNFVSKMISMPPMYAMYVFSILNKRGCKVSYSRNLSDEEIEKADYIVMTSSIICHETEVEVLKKIIKKGKKVFVVGVFANTLKDKYSLDKSFVVAGEPESFFLKVDLNAASLDEYFKPKENRNIKIYPNLVENLDDLPFPDWNYYLKKYNLQNNFLGFNSKAAIPIVATRGCPYSCFNYCTYPLQQGRKVRFRSVQNVVAEIKYWLKNTKTNKFIFRDPVFSINRNYTIELCNEILKENLKIEYLIETHLKNLDDEMIILLKKSGLKLVYIGIESSDAKVLKDIKRFTVDQDDQFKTIQKLVDNKIYVKSMFMFGNPEDDESTIKNTIDYSMQLPNQLVQYSVFTPYPGTPIFSHYEKNILEKKYEKYNQYNLVFKHKHLDNKKINSLKNYGYKKFYFRLQKLPIILKSALSLVR
jgi:anaerobic magnesium-protoporphyrin IX monomethyl ester cyclase